MLSRGSLLETALELVPRLSTLTGRGGFCSSCDLSGLIGEVDGILCTPPWLSVLEVWITDKGAGGRVEGGA